ncbi:mechanosensitive ion channel family protein [Sphingomonas sp. NFX23]|uniref:mechanosensitive ion channel family protein n=1 Tax=Sphingomonas sp. NFX23 TaxID=2819532 RepID=UPI003CF008A5
MNLIDSVLHDVDTAKTVVERQLDVPFSTPYGGLILLIAVSVAIALVGPVRIRLLVKLSAFLSGARRDSGTATYAKAVGAVAVTTVLTAVAAQIVLLTTGAILPLLPEVAAIASTITMGIGVIGFGLGIGRALRSPEDKAMRPVQMPPGLGRVIGLYPFAAGIALALNAFIDQTSRILHATSVSTLLAQMVVVTGEAVLIGRFLVLAGRARERQTENAIGGESNMAIPAVFGMTAAAWLALTVGCAAFIFGSRRFALLLLQEMLWAALLLTTAWLLTRFLDALVIRLLDTNRRAGRFATAVVGVGQARVAQIALLGSVLLTIVVWLIAVGMIAVPLHGQGGAVTEKVRPGPLLQSLQSLNISPRSVITALAMLFAGIWLTRVLRRWMENRFLPSTALDVGARSSILTALTYVGVIIAMLSATNTLGVQLEKITLIASALSVGIGFGLQSIIQNFVSGVILLIERPVKLGDWVAVSGTEGTIRKIKVRATELATVDGGISIVPNSALISSTVTNRADTLMTERLELSLSVTGCDTVRAAHDALADLVNRCNAVRAQPAPRIYLRTLGETEWTFDLCVYSEEGVSRAQSHSELLFWLSEQASKYPLRVQSA